MPINDRSNPYYGKGPKYYERDTGTITPRTNDKDGNFSEQELQQWKESVEELYQDRSNGLDFNKAHHAQNSLFLVGDDGILRPVEGAVNFGDPKIAQAGLEGKLFLKPRDTEHVHQIRLLFDENDNALAGISEPLMGIPFPNPGEKPEAPSWWKYLLHSLFGAYDGVIKEYDARESVYQARLAEVALFTGQECTASFLNVKNTPDPFTPEEARQYEVAQFFDDNRHIQQTLKTLEQDSGKYATPDNAGKGEQAVYQAIREGMAIRKEMIEEITGRIRSGEQKPKTGDPKEANRVLGEKLGKILLAENLKRNVDGYRRGDTAAIEALDKLYEKLEKEPDGLEKQLQLLSKTPAVERLVFQHERQLVTEVADTDTMQRESDTAMTQCPGVKARLEREEKLAAEKAKKEQEKQEKESKEKEGEEKDAGEQSKSNDIVNSMGSNIPLPFAPF